MVRMAGILCGSAFAISAFVVLLGVPEFLPETASPPYAEPAMIAPEDTEPAAASLAHIESPQSAPETLPAAAATPEVPADPETAIPPTTASPDEQVVQEHWYAFWSPFRSELAAEGFIAQLQRSTGMDYRVVRLQPGAYEVAFAYREDAEIARHLATISAATGLELAGD